MGAIVAKKPDISVKIDPDVYRMVKTVAAWKDLNVAEYLSMIVEPIVRKDMAKMTKEASREVERGGEGE
jgi:hypothetical protein